MKSKCALTEPSLRSFDGSESTRTNGDCETWYQISCSLTTTTTTTTRAGGGNIVKIVSYNLYWWNAFGQNSWKSDGIIKNIKDTLKPDAALQRQQFILRKTQLRKDSIEKSLFQSMTCEII